MLPQIARLKSGTNGGGNCFLILWGIALLSFPTLFATAQSQDVRPESRFTAAAGQPAQPGAPSVGASKSPAMEFFPELSHQEQKILRELDASTTFDVTDESLDEVRDTIMERHKIDIVLDKVKLEEESIAPDATDISLKVSEVPLRSALRLILRPKGLTYVIEDDVLKITTATASEQSRITRTYPVQDLAEAGPAEFQSLMQAIKQGVTPGAWVESPESAYGSMPVGRPRSAGDGQPPGGAGLPGGAPPGNPAVPSPPKRPTRNQTDASITISIVPASGSLVVRQSGRGHDEVLTLLRALRRAKSLSAKK